MYEILSDFTLEFVKKQSLAIKVAAIDLTNPKTVSRCKGIVVQKSKNNNNSSRMVRFASSLKNKYKVKIMKWHAHQSFAIMFTFEQIQLSEQIQLIIYIDIMQKQQNCSVIRKSGRLQRWN